MCWSWATGFRGLLTTSTQLCKASTCCRPVPGTQSPPGDHAQTQAGSGWPRSAPVHQWALDGSSHSSFRDDSATAQTARHPLCGPQELCLQLPNAPSAGCLPQPSGGWQRPSTLPAWVPVANFLVHFVTSESGPACACPQSLFTPSQGRGMACSCHRRSELQHKIRVQSAWHFCPLEWGVGAPDWGAGTGNTLRPGVA